MKPRFARRPSRCCATTMGHYPGRPWLQVHMGVYPASYRNKRAVRPMPPRVDADTLKLIRQSAMPTLGAVDVG
jgi:hypothetical protein